MPRVRRLLAGEFGFNEAQVNEFCGYFMRRGCEAMEKLLSHTEYHSFSETGPYVLGSDVSMADLCLIPHIQGARNFGVDVSPYKKLLAIEEALFKLPEIEKAHPKYHPGFVKPE